MRPRELGNCRFEVSVADGAYDWKPALAMLVSKIEELAWRNADLDVVLSSHLTRFLVMPWISKMSEQDAGAYARHEFHSIYGDGADAWAVCLGRACPPRPRVAAAAARALIDELTTRAAAYDLRLRSLRPLFSTLIDALPATDQIYSGWVALAEPGCAHVARLDVGHCVDIRSVRYVADSASTLLLLLRESALNTDRDMESAPVRLYSAETTDFSLLREHGWRVETVAPDFI
jgi:hypothetical protein